MTCQSHPRSSKVDDFRFCWKGLCDFLLVINSNLCFICHRFRDTATYMLKRRFRNCGQIAADGHMITANNQKNRHRPIQWYHRQPPKTYRLVTIPLEWHATVRYNSSRSSKVNDFRVIWNGLCDFLLVINSNLGPIFHRFWDMASFRLKTHFCLLPSPSNSKFENVIFALHHQKSACLNLWYSANYSKKIT